MKEIKIEVPEGYEIDKENSTFEKIVFKEKEGLPMSWEDLGDVKGYYIDSMSEISNISCPSINHAKNTWPTRELAEAALALSQLLQLRDRWNGDWRPDLTSEEDVYGIGVIYGKLSKVDTLLFARVLIFKTEKLRDKFAKHFEDLIETAKPLL